MSPDRGPFSGHNLLADTPPPKINYLEEVSIPANITSAISNMSSTTTRQAPPPPPEHPPSPSVQSRNSYQSIINRPKHHSTEIVASSPNDTICSSRHTSSSLRSSSPHSLTHTTNTSQTRRDSGYSSKRRGSRSSSKHSNLSSRDFSASEDSTTSAPPVPRRPLARRITSSSRMPTSHARQDVEGAIALHERSMQLFGPPSSSSTFHSASRSRGNTLTRSISTPQTDYQLSTSLPSTTSLPYSTASMRQSIQARSQRTNTLPSSSHGSRPNLTRAQTAAERPTTSRESCPPRDDFVPATTMHWTSNETRRKEYETIDRQCRGFRGMWNKLFSRQGTRKAFYNEKDGDGDSDAGSVRRFRLELDDGQ
jgi:hypothetical protein